MQTNKYIHNQTNQLKSSNNYQTQLNLNYHNISSPQQQLDLLNNQKLLSMFKKLRQQLAQANHDKNALQLKLNQQVIETKELKQKMQQYISQNKHRIQRLQKMNKNEYHSNQIQQLKQQLNSLKQTLQSIQQEKNQILKSSIIHKINQEKQIQLLNIQRMKQCSWRQKAQIQKIKYQQQSIKYQNELKKHQIKLSQQEYNRQWDGKNFQIHSLSQQLKQINNDNKQLLSKYKCQRNKNHSICNQFTKIQQQYQLLMLKYKTNEQNYKKLEKSYKKDKKIFNKNIQQQNENIQKYNILLEKFNKCIQFTQQLTSRIKRQFTGEILTLTKTCEFKINKLKFNPINQSSQSNFTKNKSLHKVDERNYQTQRKSSNINQKLNIIPRPISSLSHHSNKQSQMTNQSGSMSKHLQPLAQIQNIQVRIQRQRDDMEKQIRQNMMMRKCQENQHKKGNKFSQDFFRTFDY